MRRKTEKKRASIDLSDLLAGPTTPAHYQIDPEPWDVIERWGLGFHLGNVVKYVARADRKGTPIEDLEKAATYLRREITRRRAG
jgi:hypothetical protein